MGEGLVFGSVCSGIEAASVAWKPLGWRASFLSEIEPFPRAVLAHHYPDVPLHGDFTTIEENQYGPIGLLVGGTPCQPFSVAGLRGGLDDDRGNLALEYLRLAKRLKPRWLVWENVPGVLSSNGGRDFGAILGGLVELGYGFAYRVLDAQYVRVDGFGRAVPQRRRRVFVVGRLGDWRRAAAVLFERESLHGHTPPRREAGERTAPTLAARTRGGGGLGTDAELDGALLPEVSMCLNAGGMGRSDAETETILPCYGLSTQQEPKWAENVSPTLALPSKSGGGQVTAVAIQERAISENAAAGPDGKGWRDDGASYTLEARQVPQAVAFTCSEQANSFAWEREVYPTLNAQIPNDTSNIQQGVRQGYRVRRLTPTECERLQGFPDGYTNIPYRNRNDAPDGPRYKALGNSMAVNVMRWIGTRIQMVDALGLEAIGEAA